MKKFFIFLGLYLSFSSASGQEIRVIKFPELEKIISNPSNDILVLNFWATWCAPCVKEMPYFQALEDKKIPGVNVVLVNLDFVEKIKTVDAFVRRKKITSSVVLLDETDYNSWISKVDPGWAGAIPATLILSAKNGKRIFRAGDVREGELERLIEEMRSN